MAKTDLTNQRQIFVEEYVRSGDHMEAAKKAGYKDTHTLRNQACKLRRECADEIADELHRNFAEIAPRALNILSDLAENAESESVRLGATRDLLDRAGFRPVDRYQIAKEKSVEELNAQLVSLVGKDGAEMLISAFKSRRSISGPELTK
ncbi:terminase small subunit [Deltaproteobacteria bacterium]|nr:terminase small subunit [Deltaproteobacteria bacterium]